MNTVSRKFALGILLLLCVEVAFTYHRAFMVQRYLVEHEVECDPATSSCWVVPCVEGEEDCTEPYYYATVTKLASDFRRDCGTSVVDCDNAIVCTNVDSYCLVSYCPDGDECDSL